MKTEKNIVEDTVRIGSQIKEETKNILKELLDETVRGYMSEQINEEKCNEEDKNEESNDSKKCPNCGKEDCTCKKDVSEAADDEDEFEEEDAEESSEGEDAPEVEADADEEEGDDDSFLDDYKTEDGNDYDLTGEEDDDILMKVFRKLDADDELSVVKTEDGIQIEDPETGDQLELNAEPSDDEDEDVFEIENDEPTDDEEGYDFEDEEPTEEGEEDFDFEDGEGDEEEYAEDDEEDPIYEVHFNRGRKLNEDENFFDWNYQDKDPMKGLNANEPAKGKKDWDKGAPKGIAKPFPGNAKAKSAPFGSNISENTTCTNREARSKVRTNVSNARKNYIPQGSQEIHDIDGEVKRIQTENKMLKAALAKFKTSLQEAALVNVNLGQIVKLISENTTTAQEKKNIIERFANEAKTVEQSKTLYESIRQNLNGNKQSAVVLEQKTTAEPEKKVVTENVVYQSREMSNIIDLMKRVENC